MDDGGSLTKSVIDEINRRRRFLGAVMRGEMPKSDPKSYVRLELIKINADGSYTVTQKGIDFCDPEYFGIDEPRRVKARLAAASSAARQRP
jgi:hypothetical protein